MSGWDILEHTIKAFLSRPDQRPFAGPVPESGSTNLASGQAFTSEASYFTIRLVEMRLAEGGKYFTEFLPLGVCVAEYTRGRERIRAPLVLSNDLIKQMLSNKEDPGRVFFTNVNVVLRAPVKADNVSLFVGLFRLPYSDVARSVLQFAADVTEDLGGAAVAAGTRVAAKMYDRVSELFKLSTVSPRFGFLDGNALGKSRYLLVAGPLPAGVRTEDLEVTDGRLRARSGNTNDATGFDYCLVAIEQLDSLFAAPGTGSATTINALTGLPFHERWSAAVQFLAGRKIPEAEEAMLLLRADVVTSPHLTEEDRLIAVGAYDAAYSRYSQALAAPAGGRSSQVARSGRADTFVAALKTETKRREKYIQGSTTSALGLIAEQLRRAESQSETLPPSEADNVFAQESAALREILLKNPAARTASAAAVADTLAVAAWRE